MDRREFRRHSAGLALEGAKKVGGAERPHPRSEPLWKGGFVGANVWAKRRARVRVIPDRQREATAAGKPPLR